VDIMRVMPGGAWPDFTKKESQVLVRHVQIRVADARANNPDPDLPGTGSRLGNILDFRRPPTPTNLTAFMASSLRVC
jgi:hypothetical protein